MNHRHTALLVAAPLLAVLPLAGCASSSAESVEPAVQGTTAGPTPSTPIATPTGSASGVELDIMIADGQVRPAAANVPVPLGSPVVIKVTSDVTDELHLHGYDIGKEVTAGGTVEFDFTADQAGTFELETHESGLLLAKLVVS